MSGETAIHNIGTLFEPTGYAKANRQLLLQFIRRGVYPKFSPIHPEVVRTPMAPNIAAELTALMHRPLAPRHTVLFHYPAHAFFRDPAPYSIGMTMFECNRLSFTWARRCSMMDEVWVPSTFNRETFIQSGVPAHKLRVMPYGTDPDVYHPGVPSLPVPGRREYAFLSVCSFDERKGIDLLLRAFLAEFSPSEDVCLIIKTRASTAEEIGRQHAYVNTLASQLTGRANESVILLSAVHSWSEEDLARLYTCADSYVLPTRGEGWSMTVMEAMAAGLPVITTRWSAHLDFVNDQNGYLIDVERFTPFLPSQSRLLWALPSIAHLRQLMRHVYTHRPEAAAKAALGRHTVIGSFTWEASALRMLQRLQEIDSR